MENCLPLQELGNVNRAYENDLGHLEAQHKFSPITTVPTISALTEKGSLVCILS
jgi:hypothetical protein